MSRILLIGLILFMFAGVASAQIPTKGNVFFGYSYASADIVSGDHSNLNGWNGSLEGNFLPWVGIVADFGGYYGSNNFPTGGGPVHVDASVHTFLFGPQVSVTAGKFTPFAHALFGAGHVSASASGFSDSDTSFSTALGGGVDYRLWHVVAWRGQVDWLQTRFFSNTQNNFRFSTGLVLRF